MLRTLAEIDYGCTVEVVVEPAEQLLVVVRYPNFVYANCKLNRDAFILLKKHRCIRLCDVIDDRNPTRYFTFHVKERLRFKFVSNSSINADLNVRTLPTVVGNILCYCTYIRFKCWVLKTKEEVASDS